MPRRQQPRIMHERAVPFRSISCRIGTHRECVQSTPTDSPVGVPVIYEACDCPCHTVADHVSPREVPQ